MEVNQIECNHKAPLVTPDERQGLRLIFHYSNDFCSSNALQLPMDVCNIFIRRLVQWNHLISAITTWVTLTMPFVSIGTTTRMPFLSMKCLQFQFRNFCFTISSTYRLTDIEFEMDGNNAGGTAVGVDAECLDPGTTPANTKKDYIAIPFATVSDFVASPPTARRHSLFCLNSLNGKELECKIFL